MTSYNVEMAEINADKIEMIIDGFLYNLRLIANLICDISKKAISDDKKDPNGILLKEDEKKCLEREKLDRIEWINKEIDGRNLSKFEIDEITQDATRKIRTYRFPEILIKLESFIRLSHILDRGGYEYTKFFHRESDEPLEETLIRQAFDNEDKRENKRHSTICNFISYTHDFWANIKKKEISFLINDLSNLFPNTDFSDKLEIIFGNNESHKKYISEENIERVWKLIHACIKTSIKYMKYIGKSTFKQKKILNGETRVVKIITVDIEQEIIEWDVNWMEVRAVRKT